MIVLGLTGSIGMGKSTIGGMLRTLGIPVHEADHSVHQLLSPQSPARAAIAAAFPYFDYPHLYDKKTKSIKRKELGALVFADDDKRVQLEAILHPLVRKDQTAFIKASIAKGVPMVCLDIPLLFEIGADQDVDYTLVASAPPFIQRQRVLARPNMSEEKLSAILSRQMPDVQKCARADYVIKTGLGHAYAFQQLKAALADIAQKQSPKQEEKRHDPRSRS